MEGDIKCDSCGRVFDVDQLRYEDTQEKFTCPGCGSAKFKSLIEVEGLPSSNSLSKDKAPDLAGALRKMVRLMKEVHDQHIYGPDDLHDDCAYCEAIKEAEETLRLTK